MRAPAFWTLATAFAVGLFPLVAAAADAGGSLYRSPFDAAFSPDGKLLAVSDRTARSVAILEVSAGAPGAKVLREVALAGEATGLAWAPGGAAVFVAEYGAGSVAEVDAGTGKVLRRLPAGLRPMGIAIAPKRGILLVANTVTDEVSVLDLATGKERARVRVPREPFFLAVAPDESVAAAGNLLPATGAADPTSSAGISLIELENLAVADVRLPPGSTSVREVAISPDGKWAYAVHTLGRFNVPATQLERGWVNTNALSIIELAGKRHLATVLLDHPFEGAADPWGLALSGDGRTAWISLRGVHEVARVDVAGLHELLSGKAPERIVPTAYSTGTKGIWDEVRQSPEKRALLADDLSALHVAGLIERVPVSGAGPRGIDISPDGKILAVAAYFSGNVLLADAVTGKGISGVPLGPPREPDLVRRGEMLFHDATICFQHWMSCSTCHPDEGRTDGLRWDLLSDGLGTPQRTRSLLLTHEMRPTTARGVRKGIEESVPKGIEFFLRKPEPDLVEPITAYVQSLRPEPSPHLAGGKPSSAAARGKGLFDGKGDCVRCHAGALGTDLKAHKVGTGLPFYRPDDTFYTPKLVELYRTAPFLHDGRAATLLEVFTRYNEAKLHGAAADLTKAELDDLVEYLKSL